MGRLGNIPYIDDEKLNDSIKNMEKIIENFVNVGNDIYSIKAQNNELNYNYNATLDFLTEIKRYLTRVQSNRKQRRSK